MAGSYSSVAPTTALLGGGETWEVGLTGRSPDADACPQGLDLAAVTS